MNRTAANPPKLLAIRTGPGAAVLPQDLKRIHLSFAFKNEDGHMGPRYVNLTRLDHGDQSLLSLNGLTSLCPHSKFWRNCLPRLKYYNPAVSMTVDRTLDQSAPAIMTLFYAPQPSTESATSAPTPLSSTTRTSTPSDHQPFDRTDTIDMQHKTDTQILQEFMNKTKAMEVPPTPEDEQIRMELEEQNLKSEKDRALMATVNKKKRDEEERIKQAKGELERMRED
jgi:large subunit ribosomal protein MRP49